MSMEKYKGLDEATRREIKELEKITVNNSDYASYVEAQFKIFDYWVDNKKYDLSLEVLNNIKKDDDDEYYQIAKLNEIIIKYHCSKHDLKTTEVEIIKLLNNTKWQLMILFISDYLYDFARKHIFLSEYLEAIKLLKKIKGNYPFESECYIKICNFLNKSDTMKVGELYKILFEKVLEATNILKVDFNNCEVDSSRKTAERKLAHYTNPTTCNALLNLNTKEKKSSPFRLNTINNVNDPSEGQLLLAYLNNDKSNQYTAPDFDEYFHAFVSCFTFNHDSLNQFRLYGKKDNLEASGLSLVFKKGFFKDENIGGLSNLATYKQTQYITDKIDNFDIKKDHNEIENKSLMGIDKQTVMRCVYIDPSCIYDDNGNDYLHLAQRNRITFYRECEDSQQAEQNWQDYRKLMKDKTEEFTKKFKELKAIYKNLIEEKKKLDEKNPELLKDYKTFIDEILLPLKYLIKHAAFQEEQECRMVYITSLEDPKVEMEFGRFLYVDYEADVKENLDKIYIAPAATQYQPYLAKLLSGTKVKIELSNNPYRLTKL